MPKQTTTVAIATRITPACKKALDATKKQTGRSIGSMVERALWIYINSREGLAK